MNLTLTLLLVMVVLLIVDKVAFNNTFRNPLWRRSYAISGYANLGWKLCGGILLVVLAVSVLS